MSPRPGGAGAGEQALARFRRLTVVTIIATLVLIVIGGIVRISDSGLGCGPAGSGTHGWPLCEGGVLPGGSHESLIEFSHRLTAAVVGILILALVVIAWRSLRSRGRIFPVTAVAGVLVLVQAGLGGLTVEEGLDEYLVAAHLGLAMLLLGVLILLWRLLEPAAEPRRVARAEASSAGSRPLRAATATATGLVLATIVAGGLVAGTEGEGKANEPVLGAHTACGEQFPGCLDRAMPFGEGRLVDIHLTHRLFMYLAAIAVLVMSALALRERARSRAFLLAPVVLAAQIGLGIANVLAGEHAGLILAHLILGTALWGTVALAASSLVPAPRMSTAPAPRRGPAEAVA